MFSVAAPATFLYLRNLTLTHPNSPRKLICVGPPCPGTVVNGQGVIQLDNVSIQNTGNPTSVTSGTLTVSQSHFTGDGGTIIRAGPGVTLTIIGSVFENNPDATLIAAAGIVSITGSQFLGKSSNSFFANCQLTIDNSRFQDNADAALTIDCASTTVSNSLFANNFSSAFGGAIRFFAGAWQITLRADRFLNNNAPFGGAALWFAAPETADISVSVSSPTFIGNRGADGGAIYIARPLNSSVKSVMKALHESFSHNVATRAGGAISALGAELLVARSVFADNNAGTKGGAVALDNTPSSHSIFANTLFVRNHAASGSAYAGDNVDFINTTVDSNQGLAIEIGTSPVLVASSGPHRDAKRE